MLSDKLRKFLEERNIYYGQQSHPKRFSAEATAMAAEIPVENMVKTVVVKIDGKLAMAVVKAGEKVDLGKLKKLTEATSVQLASEADFEDCFDDCELGAMPPFGKLYAIQEFVDVNLGNRDFISFNAGTHTDLIQMPYKVFELLAEPVVARISR
jgi:Ala-tRNA(Pro) deacylase